MRIKAVFLVGLLALHSAGAADLPPKGKPSEEGVQVMAVWLNDTGAQNADLYVNQAGEPVKISPGSNRRSPPVFVKTPPGSAIVLVSRPKGAGVSRENAPSPSSATSAKASATAQVTYYPAGEIAWPKAAHVRRILLLLAASPGGAGAGPQIRGVAMADDIEAFPPHAIRVANFGSQPLFLRVGDKVENIPSGLSRPVPYARFAQPGEKGVPLFPVALARVSNDGSSEIFFSTNAEGRSGSRLQLIVSPSPDPTKPPFVMRLQDSAPVEQPPAPPKPLR